MPSILIVDDQRSMCESLQMLLRMEGFSAEFTTDPREAVNLAARSAPDVIVTDMRMPELSGIELLQAVKAASPRTEVIVMTAHATVDSAVSAMKLGAFDYIMKPFKNEAILAKIRRAMEKARAERQPALTSYATSQSPAPVAASAAMREVLTLAGRLAATDMAVLVTGETGTGKSAVARHIHAHSRRSKGPFVTVNCSALPENLIESELFGHEKGAFTGAVSGHRGLFKEAAGGAIFLDEIGLLPLGQQPKLLLALEERVIRPVGSARTIPVDVRVIAATNTDLGERVRHGQFREDLLYRLNAATIRIPPLRERPDDILPLCESLLSRQQHRRDVAISAEALALLQAYSFPGNVRELDNALHWAAAVASGPTIKASDLPEIIQQRAPTHAIVNSRKAETRALDAITREAILESVARHSGNLTQATKELGIGRTTLWRRMKQYGIKAR